MRMREDAGTDQGAPLSYQAYSWYPLQTRYQCEKRVDAALREQGWETFTPLQSETRRWSDRVRRVEAPLFPGYTFVRMEVKPQAVSTVLRIPGLVRIVTSGREFAVVRDEDIDSIRMVVQNGTRLEPGPFPAIGQKVRVRGGYLDGIEGILLSKIGRQDLVISVGAVQRSVRFTLGNFRIEALN
jgi:transcription termination/antitermination protein NusG